MFAARRDRPDVGGLQDHGLECLLAEPARGQPRISVDRAVAVPRLGQIDGDADADSVQQVVEVVGGRVIREVVAFALHDVGGEVRGRSGVSIVGEEEDVADDDAADDGSATDGSWHRFLSARPMLTEVNFWRPSSSREFRELDHGEPFFFKTHQDSGIAPEGRPYMVG
ncbi:hypothetical protein [Nonomuraea bangladeshensis]|uniref:hypothetical protein n=1 Tax=Nonomuraea bangladeshensis TaxID=404385 RepID=UPI003C2D2F23